MNDKQSLIEKRWLRIAALILSWTLIGFFYASRNIVSSLSQGRSIDWARGVLYEIIYWEVWIIFTPVIIWFVKRHLVSGRKWIWTIVPMTLFGLVLAPLHGIFEAAVAIAIEWGVWQTPTEELIQRMPIIQRAVLLSSFTDFITFWVIVGIYYAYDYYRKYREREIKATQLENRLSQAELQNLKMQLHPHFLFNTLHAISVLMLRDVPTARRMLIHLSDLLRITLDNAGIQEISLKQELDFLGRYLEIEQTRFQDRLTIKTDIEPLALKAVVPNLILQPLVENAIRHGVERSSKKGLVELSAAVENATLHLQVRDNGEGLRAEDEQPLKKGVGIANTKARLQQLYGESHRFEMFNAAGGGLLVKISIPFQTGEPKDPFDENTNDEKN